MCPLTVALPEAFYDIDRKEYLQNLRSVLEFKAKMPGFMREYYEPRKRYIDSQPVNPDSGTFFQLHILNRGANLRKKYFISNKKEILELEEFLKKADDFQIARYFGDFEEIYLRSKAKRSIQHIKQLAERDELWRKKNDPIFANYIDKSATLHERHFYKKNKSRFYSEFTGLKLIEFLKLETKKNLSMNLNIKNNF